MVEKFMFLMMAVIVATTATTRVVQLAQQCLIPLVVHHEYVNVEQLIQLLDSGVILSQVEQQVGNFGGAQRVDRLYRVEYTLLLLCEQ